MAENIIVTIVIGKDFEEMGKFTNPFMEQYALKVGADFDIVKNNYGYRNANIPKFFLNKYLENYKRVLYLDCDVVVQSNAEDIFKIVPIDCLGMFNEGSRLRRDHIMQAYKKEYARIKKIKNNFIYTWTQYFNAGVFLFNKDTKIFDLPPKELIQSDPWVDQNHINYQIAINKVKIYELTYKFNLLPIIGLHNYEKRKSSSFIHYAGCGHYDRRLELMKEHYLGIKKGDRNRIKKNTHGRFNFKRMDKTSNKFNFKKMDKTPNKLKVKYVK